MEVTNRTIWTLWCQGFERAPPIVQACLKSWRELNPNWRIIALDHRSIGQWIDFRNSIDFNRRDLTVQTKSDIIRLCLLRQHGGVWVDSTVYCCQPLDLWLPGVYELEFFAFRNPGPDRLLSNWLLATERDNPIFAKLYYAYLHIWETTYFSNQNTRLGRLAVKKLSPILNKNPKRSTWWIAPVIRNAVRAYPYFVFHYTFNKVVLSDPKLLRLWASSKGLDARLPHRLQHLARLPGGREQALAEIPLHLGNVQKLDWRVDAASPYWAAVLAALSDSNYVRRQEP